MNLRDFKLKAAKKDKMLSTRISTQDYNLLKKHKISPSKIFDKFLAELKLKRRGK